MNDNKLRIARLHASYRSADSGENQSFREEVLALRAAGHTVRSVEYPLNVRPSTLILSGLGFSQKPSTSVWKTVEDFNPDIIHFDNTLFRLAPTALDAARASGVPVFLSVRNYRMLGCTAGTFFYKGAHCTKCVVSNSKKPAIIRRCYRNSYLQSLFAAASLSLSDFIGFNYIAVSQHMKNMLINVGFPHEKIFVKPNCVRGGTPGAGNGGFILYLGGTSRPEKGHAILDAAWDKSWAKDTLRLTCAINFSHNEVLDLLGRAAALVVPSTWQEPFGRVVIEAFSRGTPVIASRVGGLRELIQDGTNGLLFRNNDPDDLARKLNIFVDNRKSWPEFRRNAFDSWAKYFRPEDNAARLTQIYKSVLYPNQSQPVAPPQLRLVSGARR